MLLWKLLKFTIRTEVRDQTVMYMQLHHEQLLNGFQCEVEVILDVKCQLKPEPVILAISFGRWFFCCCCFFFIAKSYVTVKEIDLICTRGYKQTHMT